MRLTLNINIPVSEELLYTLKKDTKSLRQEFILTMAVKYFEEGKLSLGKASELVNMSKNDFVNVLSQHKIDIYKYSEEDIKSEFELIDKLAEETI